MFDLLIQSKGIPKVSEYLSSSLAEIQLIQLVFKLLGNSVKLSESEVFGQVLGE